MTLKEENFKSNTYWKQLKNNERWIIIVGIDDVDLFRWIILYKNCKNYLMMGII